MVFLVTHKGINFAVKIEVQKPDILSLSINTSKASDRIVNGIVSVSIKQTGESALCDESIVLQTFITTGNPDNARLLVEVFNKTVKENSIPGRFIATLPALVYLESRVEHCF